MNGKGQQSRGKEVIVTDGKGRMGTAGLNMVALIFLTRTFFYFMLTFDDAQRCRRDYYGQQTMGQDSTGCINILGSGQ